MGVDVRLREQIMDADDNQPFHEHCAELEEWAHNAPFRKAGSPFRFVDGELVKIGPWFSDEKPKGATFELEWQEAERLCREFDMVTSQQAHKDYGVPLWYLAQSWALHRVDRIQVGRTYLWCREDVEAMAAGPMHKHLYGVRDGEAEATEAADHAAIAAMYAERLRINMAS